ncbi:MAG TPA: hypothetical protein VKH37_12495, partial [Ferruginibacter sp.]|nr:hypothetical protein [Ferruginibacter sp.]
MSKTFVDSLLNNYKDPAIIKQTNDEIDFWGSRIDPKNPGLVNELKYASALVRRFHLKGNINDLVVSDSILRKVDTTFNHIEAAPMMSLSGHAILQHRFKEADEYFSLAKKISIKKYEEFTVGFDVDFESGRYLLAESELASMNDRNDYGYEFRLSKLMHYKGELDKAVDAMQKAAENAGNEVFLKQAALSNVADLYMHSGDAAAAYKNYVASISLDPSDLHSIMGIGWLALVHDGNDSLAEKIFRFVATKTKSPDPLLKLIQVAEQRNDSVSATRHAREFEQRVSAPVYGNMYNKYMIDLYTSILHEPAKAEGIAQRELDNRNTPQTQAWYTWTLYANGKTDAAYKQFQEKVSGKPLEGLELYWMGKLMKGLDKGYN